MVRERVRGLMASRDDSGLGSPQEASHAGAGSIRLGFLCSRSGVCCVCLPLLSSFHEITTVKCAIFHASPRESGQMCTLGNATLHKGTERH